MLPRLAADAMLQQRLLVEQPARGRRGGRPGDLSRGILNPFYEDRAWRPPWRCCASSTFISSRSPRAGTGQRYLRTREQRDLLCVLRHGGEYLPDRWRPGHPGAGAIGPVVSSACDYFAPVAFPSGSRWPAVARLGNSSVQYELALSSKGSGRPARPGAGDSLRGAPGAVARRPFAWTTRCAGRASGARPSDRDRPPPAEARWRAVRPGDRRVPAGCSAPGLALGRQSSTRSSASAGAWSQQLQVELIEARRRMRSRSTAWPAPGSGRLSRRYWTSLFA